MTDGAHPILVIEFGSRAAFAWCQVFSVDIPEWKFNERASGQIVTMTADTLGLDPMLTARNGGGICWDRDLFPGDDIRKSFAPLLKNW
jgi:hypothetical protein